MFSQLFCERVFDELGLVRGGAASQAVPVHAVAYANQERHKDKKCGCHLGAGLS
jgi:hypothetical protein